MIRDLTVQVCDATGDAVKSKSLAQNIPKTTTFAVLNLIGDTLYSHVSRSTIKIISYASLEKLSAAK